MPASCACPYIAVKELLPTVASCALWNQQMRGCHIRCKCDNAAVVSMINRHTSRTTEMFLICAKFSISLSAERLPGHLNRINSVSFFQVVPYTEEFPCSIPSQLLDVLIHHQPNWLSAEWSETFQACLYLRGRRVRIL